MWGNMRQTQSEGNGTNYLTSNLQNCQGHQKKRKEKKKSEKPLQLKEPKETWRLNVMWSLE